MPAPDDIRLTFDQVPDLYQQVRPTCPPELLDAIFEQLPDEPRIVEVGPGTGQMTADLLARGAHVTAVELGSNLASAVSDRFSDSDRLTVINAPFESAPLPMASFEAVVSANAYHWIDPIRRATRPFELLEPGGWLGLIELMQVESDVDRGYFERVQPIYESFGDTRHDWDAPTHETAVPRFVAELTQSDLFDDPVLLRVLWDQTYTSAEFRDLMLTYSNMRMMPDDERDDLVAQLTAVVDDELGGSITRPLVATLTLARARSDRRR